MIRQELFSNAEFDCLDINNSFLGSTRSDIIKSMKLPNRKNSVIPKEKLTNYLLSETHSTGKFKARFFRNLGFNKSNIDLFEKFIYRIAQDKTIIQKSISAYGIKYAIDGEIETPNGETVKVRTVWIIEKGQKNPRFITLYPV